MVTPLGKDPLILPYIYEIPLFVLVFGRVFSFIFFLSYFLGCHASLTPHICWFGDIFILKLTLFTPTTWDTKWSSHSLLGYSRATKPFGHPLPYILRVTSNQTLYAFVWPFFHFSHSYELVEWFGIFFVSVYHLFDPLKSCYWSLNKIKT